MVTSPAVMYHPYTAMLWVHLSGLHKPVQVTIQLQRADRTHNVSLLERKVQEPHLYLNITFPVSVTPRTAVSMKWDALDPLLSAGRAVSTSSPEHEAVVPHGAGSEYDFPIFWWGLIPHAVKTTLGSVQLLGC